MRKWASVGACLAAAVALGSALLAQPGPREAAGDAFPVVGKSYTISGPGVAMQFCTVAEPPRGGWVKVKTPAGYNSPAEGPGQVHWVRLDAVSVFTEEAQGK